MTGKSTSSPSAPTPWGRYLLVFFMMSWMFVLGVMVGRGCAPVTFDISKLEKDLVARRQTATREEQTAVEKAVRGESEKTPLVFYDALTSDETDADVSILSKNAASRQSDGEPVHKARSPLMGKDGAAQPASRPPESAGAPVAAAAPRPEASSPQPAAATTGDLTIQVAATKDGEAAERIVVNLKKEGYASYLSRIVVPGKGLWFRVRVGSYQSREQAEKDMARLKQAQWQPILMTR
ncbi:SPOR domain-containing protein [Desulfosarcina sp. OttesenSCG-928-A07]|nr:SPOR domain-containing protein [Desulfosarcina sp. OttesenSCG-928-G17]MDL2328950.1 SPOR domain-containing protein [Desulfosarcina sp. OttesenSCG-928-A07]